MKLLFSIFLSTTILLSSFNNVLVYIAFKIHQKEIAKTICVLRAQKNNACKGNCVLKAELKKAAENEKKQSTILKEKTQIVYTITATSYNITPIKYTQINKTSSLYLIVKPKSMSFSIFHPPTTV